MIVRAYGVRGGRDKRSASQRQGGRYSGGCIMKVSSVRPSRRTPTQHMVIAVLLHTQKKNNQWDQLCQVFCVRREGDIKTRPTDSRGHEENTQEAVRSCQHRQKARARVQATPKKSRPEIERGAIGRGRGMKAGVRTRIAKRRERRTLVCCCLRVAAPRHGCTCRCR